MDRLRHRHRIDAHPRVPIDGRVADDHPGSPHAPPLEPEPRPDGNQGVDGNRRHPSPPRPCVPQPEPHEHDGTEDHQRQQDEHAEAALLKAVPDTSHAPRPRHQPQEDEQTEQDRPVQDGQRDGDAASGGAPSPLPLTGSDPEPWLEGPSADSFILCSSSGESAPVYRANAPVGGALPTWRQYATRPDSDSGQYCRSYNHCITTRHSVPPCASPWGPLPPRSTGRSARWNAASSPTLTSLRI